MRTRQEVIYDLAMEMLDHTKRGIHVSDTAYKLSQEYEQVVEQEKKQHQESQITHQENFYYGC